MASVSDPVAGTPVIEATNVSKRFRLRSGSIKHAILDRGRPREELWALRDVSFALPATGALGVVGDNGSGKSTLLKLLAGVMPPTTGHVSTRGRIGTLIEIGAGFHPDLTGRENVYLNAALLGMRRADVRRRFDEIVAFAELEWFMDTPVKRYSSGMFLRLGFAIAAHVDPDVLLIDEVLAVGDAAFQRKCMRRLREFRQRGGTMVLVSHGLGLITEHCEQAIWLDHGAVRAAGDPTTVTDAYARSGLERPRLAAAELDPDDWTIRPETAAQLATQPTPADLELLGVQVLDLNGQPASVFKPGEAVRVRIGYLNPGANSDASFTLSIVRSDGLRMFTTTAQSGAEFAALGARGDLIVELPFLALAPGMYRLTASASAKAGNGRSDSIEQGAALDITGDPTTTDSTFMPVRWHAPE